MDNSLQTISATDGYPLGAKLWTAVGTPQGVVVMHPATGVPQRIYQVFAQHLAGRGFHAITYDYRGIGASRPNSLRGFAARMRDWMLLDAEGVTRWARGRYPELPQLAVGHSVGGHAIGMCSAGWGLAGAVLVASHTGNSRFIRQRGERWRVELILRVVGPAMARLIGYVPGKRMGLGEDLPGGVAIEWGAWGGMQRYFFDDPTLGAVERFNRVTNPVLVYGFDDDPWATPPAINALTTHFTSTWVERRQIAPAEAGGAVGHMGFFRPQFAETLWPGLTNWLSERAAATRVSEAAEVAA
ncbi:serine aminopeptidase domain-containing protein [Ralstonia sp. UBA689]|uniref:alpha/beta hydrolase family protein n=1 Tax=Ralstonia sp. UBA689 TaxID=1947373 RepID=UPI0025D1FE65|nr:alpha/beta hydrolase [Ralstonia sp. UBA689]